LDAVLTADPVNNHLDNLLSYQNNHLSDNSVPAPLIAKPISSTRINLSWLPPLNQYGQKLAGYEIELKNAPGDYTVIDENTGTGTTQYSVDGLTSNTTYTYRIFAVYLGTHSNPSNEASATTLEYIPPPVQKPNQNTSSVSTPPSGTTYPQTIVPPVASNVQLDFTAPDGVLLSGIVLSQSDYQQLVIIKDPRSILSNVTQTSSTLNNVLSGILRYQTLHAAKEQEITPPTPAVNSSQPLQQPSMPRPVDNTLLNGVITSVVASGVVGITTWFVRTKIARKIAKEYHFTLEYVSSTMSSQIQIRNSGETIEDCIIICERDSCVWTDTNLDKPRHIYEGSVSSVTIPTEFENQNPMISVKTGKKTLRKIMLDDMAHG
ncbi:MAG: fibronectin type III domain-containing protein, partial [Nitrosotalea sp.]